MRDKSSKTAKYIALARALETVRPQPRLFEDSYAARFLGMPVFIRLASIPPIARAIERSIDRRFPAGNRGNAVIRTRVIDELLTGALSDGAEQVVLLGAGHDSRAYRMPAMRQVEVFEVDHPATQAVKQARVRRHVPPEHRRHVRFVPVDLLRDSLDRPLRSAGFRTMRTAVIWEGVTSYLDPESVAATIAWFSENTTIGSSLIFTYVEAGSLRPTPGRAEPSDLANTFSAVDEPMTFGFAPDELADYVATHGLDLVHDVSATEAAARYLHPLGRNVRVGSFSHIAEVRKSS